MGEEYPSGLQEVRVRRPGGRAEGDLVAVEEPLEIRVGGTSLVVTMRTPGADRELAAGFLYAEEMVEDREDILSLEPLRRARELVGLAEESCAAARGQCVEVTLRPGLGEELARRRGRQFAATAACGVCGKRALEDLQMPTERVRPVSIGDGLLGQLPERMREKQELFRACGGLHAAGLFDSRGELLCLREDIGRHNAVDKVVGWSLLHDRLPLDGTILVTSGRAGYEIVQKALRARASALVAVGAASSLAVELALRCGLALYTFVAPGRGNLHV